MWCNHYSIGIFFCFFCWWYNIIQYMYMYVAGDERAPKDHSLSCSITSIRKWPELNEAAACVEFFEMVDVFFALLEYLSALIMFLICIISARTSLPTISPNQRSWDVVVVFLGEPDSTHCFHTHYRWTSSQRLVLSDQVCPAGSASLAWGRNKRLENPFLSVIFRIFSHNIWENHPNSMGFFYST